MSKLSKSLVKIIAFIFILGLAIQLIPYGRVHSNPPVRGEPQWANPETRSIFSRACGNCHSNETIWPWYSHVAPASWLIQYDVEHGRSYFNVSEWGYQKKNRGDEAVEEIEKGSMPPFIYQFFYKSARLNSEEKTVFIKGLGETFGAENIATESEEHE